MSAGTRVKSIFRYSVFLRRRTAQDTLIRPPRQAISSCPPGFTSNMTYLPPSLLYEQHGGALVVSFVKICVVSASYELI